MCHSGNSISTHVDMMYNKLYFLCVKNCPPFAPQDPMTELDGARNLKKDKIKIDVRMCNSMPLAILFFAAPTLQKVILYSSSRQGSGTFNGCIQMAQIPFLFVLPFVFCFGGEWGHERINYNRYLLKYVMCAQPLRPHDIG